MESPPRLAAADLASAIRAFRDALRTHQEVINRLNVYPVPDGDTGTNMALTMESVVTELDALGQDPDMAAVAKAVSHGSLMGARGNSGVILSQVLRGLSGVWAEAAEVGAEEMDRALQEAAEAAYKAVMKPVEGTILTVARALADGAHASGGGDLVGLLEGARVAGQEALERTPEMLPVLKRAGVVDAGGSGLMLLADALLHIVDGRPLPEAPAPTGGVESQRGAGDPEFHAEGEEDISGLRYEVMYLLEARDESVPAFKDVWAGVGDSIVVVGGDGLWNCHIHTDDIGAAIEAALDAGRPRHIRVTDLLEQVEEERWVREAELPEEDDEWVGEPPATAIVAVATGTGIRRIFRSLGVHQMVAGGQSMNPSTAQILEAVEAAPAVNVVILPNNKNIIPVAEQVAGMTSKAVEVVGTADIAEGFAALMAYDPQADSQANARNMAEASRRVVSGEVTQAVRDSDGDAGPIQAGDWLGLSRAGIEVVATSLFEAASGLLEKLVTDDHEIVTVIEGEGARPADTRRLTEWLSEHRPLVDQEIHHGGQPLYPYLFSIE